MENLAWMCLEDGLPPINERNQLAGFMLRMHMVKFLTCSFLSFVLSFFITS